MNKKESIKTLLGLGILPTPNEIKKLQEREKIEQKPIKKVSTGAMSKVEVIQSFEYKPKKITVEDFTQNFRSRYRAIKDMLLNRAEAEGAVSISKLTQTKEKATIIAIISNINKLPTGTIRLTLEDPSGEIMGIISSKNTELIKKSQYLSLDEVIALTGSLGKNVFFINDIIWPDIPMKTREKCLDDVYVAFSGDLHAGSNTFLPELLNKFIEWLNGRLGNEKQKEIAKKTKYIFLLGDICVTPDTLVLTKKGLKKIKEIKEEEEVLTHKNRWQKVKKVFKRKIQEEVSGLSTDFAGPDIILTNNHPVWATIRPNRYFSVRGSPSWIRADKLNKTHSVFNIKTEESFHKLEKVFFSDPPKKDQIKSSRIPKEVKIDKDFLTTIGLFLGDGTIKLNNRRGIVRFSFGKRKKEALPRTIVERWARKLNLNLLTQEKENLVILYINSKPLAQFFNQFYTEKKKDIPTPWLNIPLEQFKWLVYGLILSDGTIEKRKERSRVRISNTSYHLLKKIKLRLEFSGIYSSLNLSRKKGLHKFRNKISQTKDYYELNFGNETTMPILELFDFKKGKRRNLRNYRESFFYILKKISSNKKIKYKGIVYNLEVENDDSYIANGIIVHNCDGVGVYPGQDKELNVKDIYEQYKLAASFIARIPQDKQVIICPGNHDSMRIAEPQPPLYKDIAAPLYELPNVINVSNPAYVNIHNVNGFPGLNVLMYHGYSFDYFIDKIEGLRNAGGYDRPDLLIEFLLKRRHLAPTYGSTLAIPMKEDPLLIRQVPDIVATGHIHKAKIAQYKGVLTIAASCWQKNTSFQDKVGLHAEPARVPILNLNTGKATILKFN